MQFKIRPSTREDLPAILGLVQELAIYEKAPEAVTATLADYQTNFEEGVFESHVAENEAGEVVGMTIFLLVWSTWKGRMLWLEDFMVNENWRQFGVGQLLFDAFLAEAKARNCVLTKWQVLDWNQPAIRFYEKNGAIIERDWWNGKLFL